MKRKPVTKEDMIRMSSEDQLKRTDFFVEANSNERMWLWNEYYNKNNDKDKLEWVQDNAGCNITVGYIKNDKKMPVCVSFSFYAISDKYVCFYEVTSRYADYTMVEDWIEKNYPVKYDNGSRRAMTDAGNFHSCYNFCKYDDNYKNYIRNKKLNKINQKN